MMKRFLSCVLLFAILLAGVARGAFVNPADWAVLELTEAAELNLIPQSLADADLSERISRAEFAALSVTLYEAISGQTIADDGDASPFWDTDDRTVLKAVGLGITNGVGGGQFRPDEPVSRQDAATMLTRVYKQHHFTGWSLVHDREFTLPLTGIVFFNDHDRIDDWARDAVYFLRLSNVVKGDNHHNFNPHNNDGQFTDGTGTATRQEAILMSLRLFYLLTATSSES